MLCDMCVSELVLVGYSQNKFQVQVARPYILYLSYLIPKHRRKTWPAVSYLHIHLFLYSKPTDRPAEDRLSL